MATKKGAYVYQQIEQTAAEWEDDATVYPPSVWLFERLENGKFNMKLSDGVHVFSELEAMFQDAEITVKTNTETAYVLTVTIGALSFDTPNLKGKSAYQSWLDAGNAGTEAEFAASIEYTSNKVAINHEATETQYPTAKSVWDLIQDVIATIPAGGLKVPLSVDLESELEDPETLSPGDYFVIQDMDVTSEGHTGRAWVNYEDPADTDTPLVFYKVIDQYFSPDGTSLILNGGGSIQVSTSWLEQQIDDAISGLTSSDSSMGTRLTVAESGIAYMTGYNAVSSLSNVNVASKQLTVATVSSNQLLSLTGTPPVNIAHILVKNSGSSAITIAIPTTGSYKSRIGASATVPASGSIELSILRDPVESLYIITKYNGDSVMPSFIIIDQTITDPAAMISGDVNGKAIQWIRNNSHRYLGKYTAAGKMTVCQLNDSDGTKYSDGTTANLTGTEGDVWMKLPRFFYHAEEIETDVWKIGFGLDKVDNTWKEWDGTDLIGVYEAYNTGSKTYSRSGVATTGSISQAIFKTYARARGDGYTIVKHKHQNIMAFLFYAKYGNTNCQALIGSGTNSYTKNSGETNALGMVDTQAATNGNTQSINFWGLENWWGNKYEWLDNVVCNPVSANGVWCVTEDDGSTRDVQGVVANDWVYFKKMVIGKNLDLVMKVADAASGTTGYCDAQYISNSTARVVARSCYNSNANGGVACAAASYDSSGTSAYIGSRLAFRGEITEAESVAAYKAIAVTN
jgi:hypothetical protein